MQASERKVPATQPVVLLRWVTLSLRTAAVLRRLRQDAVILEAKRQTAGFLQGQCLGL